MYGTYCEQVLSYNCAEQNVLFESLFKSENWMILLNVTILVDLQIYPLLWRDWRSNVKYFTYSKEQLSSVMNTRNEYRDIVIVHWTKYSNVSWWQTINTSISSIGFVLILLSTVDLLQQMHCRASRYTSLYL